MSAMNPISSFFAPLFAARDYAVAQLRRVGERFQAIGDDLDARLGLTEDAPKEIEHTEEKNGHKSGRLATAGRK